MVSAAASSALPTVPIAATLPCRRRRRRLQGINDTGAAAAAWGGAWLLGRQQKQGHIAAATGAPATTDAAATAATPAAGGSSGRACRGGAASKTKAAVQVLSHVRRTAGACDARRQLAARVHAGRCARGPACHGGLPAKRGCVRRLHAKTGCVGGPPGEPRPALHCRQLSMPCVVVSPQPPR